MGLGGGARLLQYCLSYFTLFHRHSCHDCLFIWAEDTVCPGKDVVQTSDNVHWSLEGPYVPQLQSVISYMYIQNIKSIVRGSRHITISGVRVRFRWSAHLLLR